MFRRVGCGYPAEHRLDVVLVGPAFGDPPRRGLRRIDDASQFLDAIERIKEEGEGTSKSPEAKISHDELAHYYKFGEIYQGRRLIETSEGKWAYIGDPVPFPETYPMAMVPKGGWTDGPPDLLAKFRNMYAKMLALLQEAWDQGGDPGQATLKCAVEVMRNLSVPAIRLMKTPRHGFETTYGPDFQVIPNH